MILARALRANTKTFSTLGASRLVVTQRRFVPGRTVRVALVGLVLVLATCRLDRLVQPPRGGLLCVTPSLPDTLRDSAASGSMSPRGDTISIRNCGGGELRWRASVPLGSPWLSILPESGVVGNGSAPRVVLNPASLGTGTYTETIVINSTTGNGVADVPVSFIIQPCSITPIRLDDSSSGTLSSGDCGAPHRGGSFARIYSFPGTADDSASIELSANYDAYVILDSTVYAGSSLAETNDCLGGIGNPCLYYQRLPTNTLYHVEVTSAAAGDSGAFTLRLVHPRLPRAPNGLDQRLTDSVTSVSPGATVHQSSILLRALVSDPDLADGLHLEAEVRPVGVAFSGPNVPDGQAVANGDPAWVGVVGLVDKTSYHWRVRAGDNTGRTGPWTAFGRNPDFAVNVLHMPNPPTTLGQARPDGTGILTGGTTDTNVVILGAVVSDSDPGDLLRLQVEVRPVGIDFSGPTDSSAAVPNGGPLQVTVGPLGRSGYHWRARAVDQTGGTGNWVAYGGNAELAADFTVATPHDPAAPSALAQLQSADLTPIPVGGVPQSDSVVIQGTVTDPDPGQTVLLDVEVQPVAQTFLDRPNYSGALVASGTTVQVTVGPLVRNGGYHWQARVRDNTGSTSAWVAFGGNPETAADFAFPIIVPKQLVFAVQPSQTPVNVAIAPPIQVAALDSSGQIVTGFTGLVTMTLQGKKGTGKLSGTTRVNAVAGVATFSDLSINRTGTGYVLRATTSAPALVVNSVTFIITF